ncbi:MAG: tRNA (adenosine(37)-N6)-threonylcarbamoyltransferase complex ATPase subunit type 1 TsaE [Alphaproteobacteria bacterium]|jgi:tRNA threonylcarbamoyladenosine biosynthesis protein TsaE|nr:tRNA (adenosine(37)-N6)-threonylcarbamoyltransferase complex ATPase subunit type 1 TsaE [Alphaproteobacteria bacterium]
MTSHPALRLTSLSPDTTALIARRLGGDLGPGDVILLSGPVGAGKSHFARALIQSRLAMLGRHEDVPSPTYTLIQTYDLGRFEIYHADLYRLGDAGECDELGLFEAFDSAVCLVEWPERLGRFVPKDALHLKLTPDGDSRVLTFASTNPRWHARLAGLEQTQ